MEPESSSNIDIKLKRTEGRFEELAKQKNSLMQSLEKTNKELIELQGAHKVLIELSAEKDSSTINKKSKEIKAR